MTDKLATSPHQINQVQLSSSHWFHDRQRPKLQAIRKGEDREEKLCFLDIGYNRQRDQSQDM